MTLFQFEVLCKVIEEGSFTLAANKLDLTQPAVSHAIKALELELNLSLLHRGRSGVYLTNDGELIWGYVKQVLDLKKQIHLQASAINGFEAGIIRLGIFPSVSAKLLPDILEVFRENYPAISLVLFEIGQDQIRDDLHSGKLDAGFVTISKSEVFNIIPIMQDDFVVILPEEYQMGEQKIDFQYISSIPFIMPKGGCADSIASILKRNGVSPDTRYNIHDISTILAMVRKGFGWSLVPETSLLHHETGIKRYKLEGESYRSIGLATPSKNISSPAVQAFLDTVIKMLN